MLLNDTLLIQATDVQTPTDVPCTDGTRAETENKRPMKKHRIYSHSHNLIRGN